MPIGSWPEVSPESAAASAKSLWCLAPENGWKLTTLIWWIGQASVKSCDIQGQVLVSDNSWNTHTFDRASQVLVSILTTDISGGRFAISKFGRQPICYKAGCRCWQAFSSILLGIRSGQKHFWRAFWNTLDSSWWTIGRRRWRRLACSSNCRRSDPWSLCFWCIRWRTYPFYSIRCLGCWSLSWLRMDLKGRSLRSEVRAAEDEAIAPAGKQNS